MSPRIQAPPAPAKPVPAQGPLPPAQVLPLQNPPAQALPLQNPPALGGVAPLLILAGCQDLGEG